MSERAEHINLLYIEHRNFEMSQALRTSSREVFSRVSVAHSTGLFKDILDTDISAYAAPFLTEDFSKAELLCFSADAPLTIEIIQDESGRKYLFTDGFTGYAYRSNTGATS